MERTEGGSTRPETDFTVQLEQTVGHSTTPTGQGQAAKEWVRENLHGRTLDSALGVYPSVEHVALHIYRGCRDLLSELTAVQVSPEAGTWVTYRP